MINQQQNLSKTLSTFTVKSRLMLKLIKKQNKRSEKFTH